MNRVRRMGGHLASRKVLLLYRRNPVASIDSLRARIIREVRRYMATSTHGVKLTLSADTHWMAEMPIVIPHSHSMRIRNTRFIERSVNTFITLFTNTAMDITTEESDFLFQGYNNIRLSMTPIVWQPPRLIRGRGQERPPKPPPKAGGKTGIIEKLLSANIIIDFRVIAKEESKGCFWDCIKYYYDKNNIPGFEDIMKEYHNIYGNYEIYDEEIIYIDLEQLLQRPLHIYRLNAENKVIKECYKRLTTADPINILIAKTENRKDCEIWHAYYIEDVDKLPTNITYKARLKCRKYNQFYQKTVSRIVDSDFSRKVGFFAYNEISQSDIKKEAIAAASQYDYILVPDLNTLGVLLSQEIELSRPLVVNGQFLTFMVEKCKFLDANKLLGRVVSGGLTKLPEIEAIKDKFLKAEKIAREYNVDIVRFLTISAWSFYMLLSSGVKFSFLDKAQYNMLIRAKRGGYCDVIRFHSEAKNIRYLDVNGLYSHIMTMSLPYEGFRFIDFCNNNNDANKNNKIYEVIDKYANYGFYFEVDLYYEENNAHFDFPLAPYHKGEKLVCDFAPRMRYVVYWLNLLYYIENGMYVGKIHRILAFREAPYLKNFIARNIARREATNDKTERDLYKIINNSICGKTMENVIAHTIATKTKADDYEIHLKNSDIAMWAIEANGDTIYGIPKTQLYQDKPIYAGITVMELAKLYIYQMHYKILSVADKLQIEPRPKLLYVDTDALIYENLPDSVLEYLPISDTITGDFKEVKKDIKGFVAIQPKMFALKGEERYEKYVNYKENGYVRRSKHHAFRREL